MIEIERGSREGAEHGSASIYRTGNKHGAAGVDPSGYRFVYTASACRALPPLRQVVAPSNSSFRPFSNVRSGTTTFRLFLFPIFRSQGFPRRLNPPLESKGGGRASGRPVFRREDPEIGCRGARTSPIRPNKYRVNVNKCDASRRGTERERERERDGSVHRMMDG